MKTSIKKLAILALIVVTGLQLKAQFHVGINAMGTMPISNWAEQGAVNFGINPSKGNAAFGAGIGIRFQYDFSWRYNGIVSPFVDIDGMWNQRNAQMRAHFEPISFTLGHYINAPIMAGATYRYFLNYQKPIIGFFIEGAIGADLLYLTQEGWENNAQTYKLSPALALRAGLGICLTPQLNIGVHYTFLGNHEIVKDKAGTFEGEVIDWTARDAQGNITPTPANINSFLPEKLKESAVVFKLTYIIKGNKLKQLPLRNSPL